MSLVAEYVRWADETFPNATPAHCLLHFLREAEELREEWNSPVPAPSKMREEAADCYLLLVYFARLCGFDLEAEARRKFEVNKTRTWGRPDAEGVVEHVRRARR